MSSRVWEFVEEGYKAIKACLMAFVDFSLAGREAVAWAQSGGTGDMPDRLSRTIAAAAKGLSESTTAARTAIETMKPFISALGGSTIRFGRKCAPSLAEAVVKLAESTAKRIGDGDGLNLEDQDFVSWLLHLQQVREGGRPERMFLDIERELAALEKEAASLALLIRRENASIEGFRFGLWRVVNEEVELLGELRKLHGLSARLLCYLILADGRLVGHAELAEKVWSDECTSDPAIRQGKHQLKKDLHLLGHPEVAEAIESYKGGYFLALS